MRILDTIPHPVARISILHMNEKFILKIENGPYEQVFKFTHEMAPDIETVKKIADAQFIEQQIAAFDQMHQSFFAAFMRNRS